MSINFLKLMHLADSAFPIGAASHSFGIETLAAEGDLTAPAIEHFLTDLLWESGKLDAGFCRLGHHNYATGTSDKTDSRYKTVSGQEALGRWLRLNQTIAAAKGARESRHASATLGRRFLQMVAQLEAAAPLQSLYQQSVQTGAEIHYCAAFGLVGGYLALDEEETVLAYLQQMIMGMVSACQRLLPVGQGRAGEILWRLKPVIAQVAQSSREGLLYRGCDGSWGIDRADNSAFPPEQSIMAERMSEAAARCPLPFPDFSTFTPLVDLGSMRHPTLPTRLFIS